MRPPVRSVSVAECLAFLVCLVCFLFAGTEPSTEARAAESPVAESSVDARETGREGDDDNQDTSADVWQAGAGHRASLASVLAPAARGSLRSFAAATLVFIKASLEFPPVLPAVRIPEALDHLPSARFFLSSITLRGPTSLS